MDGMIEQPDGRKTVGAILGLWKQLRESVGVVEAKKKDGVKFKVRSAEDLIDKVRDRANELGILIYPVPSWGDKVGGKGQMLETRDSEGSTDFAGTTAEVSLVVRCQAIEDGSYIELYGFGLGADNQDKAGGKAGTYAFKQALIQALLAGGKENARKLGVVDTDDSDTPIQPATTRRAAKDVDPSTPPKGSQLNAVLAEVNRAQDRAAYEAALARAMTLKPAEQMQLKEALKAAAVRCPKPVA
jgi:hypothetical protein